MAFLLKISSKLKPLSPCILTSRTLYLNRDWQPGPLPITREEYEAAAKKYNMPVEDYKPLDPEWYGAGDYPDLPIVSSAFRDPYYPYDYPHLKRNYGEPIHEHYDLYTEDKYDYNTPTKYPTWLMHLCFWGWMSLWALLFAIGELFKIGRPFMPKQYPGMTWNPNARPEDCRIGFKSQAFIGYPAPDVKHYTFEPLDD